ncbi:hypothetical protein ACROYT_G002042 [Oculina patagonica]
MKFPCLNELYSSSKRNSAALSVVSVRFALPCPLRYCGRNHSIKSTSKPLPLSACAIVRISCGTAQIGILGLFHQAVKISTTKEHSVEVEVEAADLIKLGSHQLQPVGIQPCIHQVQGTS